MRKRYPSDPSRKQFEEIRPLLESARKKTRPRTVDLYEIFCAVAYVLKGGIPWRMLPDGFPTWQTAYAYWVKWSEAKPGEPSLLEQALKKSGLPIPTQTWAQRHPERMHPGFTIR